MADWYTGSVEYAAVAQYTTSHTYAAGAIVRQLAAPAVGSERCFRTSAGGTTGGSEPTWTLTKGGSTTDGGGVVWTEVTGNSTYNWSAPHARLASALAWGAAGDNFYVSDDHAETQATSLTLTFPGTSASPNLCFCVNHAGSIPPVSADLRTTGTISTAVSASAIYQTAGCFYMYGLALKSAATTSSPVLANGSAASQDQTFDSCSFVGTSGSTLNFVLGAATGNIARRVTLINTPFVFGASGNSIFIENVDFRWLNTPSAINSGASTTLFSGGSSLAFGSTVRLDGVDLSVLGSGQTIVGAISQNTTFQLNNCKLGSGVTVAATPTTRGGAETYLTISDSANTTYRQEKYAYEGTLTADTTDVRSGGASDGTTPIAWKVVTTANADAAFPFECFEIAKWNGSVGSPITVSIPIMSNATLKTSDIWPEVEYLGNGSFPISSLASGRVADLLPSTAGSNWATDSVSSWTTTGVSGPVLQTLSVTFTPQQVGYVRVRIKVAKASQTVRIDPLLQGF